MEDLHIGSIVHYAYNLGNGEPPVCVPAIVCIIYHKGTGNIAVREFQTMDLKSCLYAESREHGGAWHWPEKV